VLLEDFSVFNNLLTEVPEELADCVSLQDLNLGDNKFTGGIPAGLADLENLEKVVFDDNMFSGLNVISNAVRSNPVIWRKRGFL
jgi:hypothetical protein